MAERTLQTSRERFLIIQIAFKISPLSKRLNLVLSASCRVIGDILLQVRHSYSLQVTVQDLLSAFGHRFCTEVKSKHRLLQSYQDSAGGIVPQWTGSRVRLAESA